MSNQNVSMTVEQIQAEQNLVRTIAERDQMILNLYAQLQQSEERCRGLEGKLRAASDDNAMAPKEPTLEFVDSPEELD